MNQKKQNVDMLGTDPFTGVGLDPNDVTGVSCLDSANHILAFMSPTPKCWKCYIERRGSWGAPFGGGDENFIRCDDVTSTGYSDLSYVFDWWYRRTKTIRAINRSTQPNLHSYFHTGRGRSQQHGTPKPIQPHIMTV